MLTFLFLIATCAADLPRLAGDALFIRGRLEATTYDFVARSDLASIRVVDLDSYGGSAEWGLALARLVRTRGWDTRLRSGSVCASACVFVFGAGRRRSAPVDAWLGVHAAHGTNLELARRLTREAFEFLEAGGTHPQFARHYEDTRLTRPDWVVEAREAYAYGLITEFSTPDPATVLEEKDEDEHAQQGDVSQNGSTTARVFVHVQPLSR